MLPADPATGRKRRVKLKLVKDWESKKALLVIDNVLPRVLAAVCW